MSNKIEKEDSIKIIVSLKTYPLDAIYGAAYAFIDRAYIFLEEAGNEKVAVNLKGQKKLNKEGLELLKGEFQNELLNFSLRIELEKKNKKIRQRIIERALYASIGDEDETWDK